MASFLPKGWRTLVENMTADGDYPSTPIKSRGRKAFAFTGAFDTATVDIVFFTPDGAGGFTELISTSSTQYQITSSSPLPETFNIPKELRFKFRVSGSGTGTDLSVNAHDVVDK